MLLAGVLMIGLLSEKRRWLHPKPRPLLAELWPFAIGPRGKLALGLTLGFLPCGLVYAALLKAMESASPVAGALTMFAFGSGTAMALLSMGFVSSFAGLRLGPWTNRLSALAVMLFGAILLWRGLSAAPVLPWLAGIVSANGSPALFSALSGATLSQCRPLRHSASALLFRRPELWINEFAIIFFALMFLMFLVVVSSVFYGRVYCGYLCPQMIFSEASMAWNRASARWIVSNSSAGIRYRAHAPPPASVLSDRWRRLHVPGLHLHFLFRRAARSAAQPRLARYPHRRRHRRRQPSRSSPSSISPSSASASAPPSAPMAICRACSAIVHSAGALPRRDPPVHRMQEVRARLPHGHRYPQVAVPDRVHPLRRVHRCLRRGSGPAEKARADPLRLGRKGAGGRHDAGSRGTPSA